MPLKKIGRAIRKTVRKIVPKEISGIMQVAAPFVAATPAGIPAALALSLGGQLRSGRGRISPLKTLLAIAPSRAFRDFTTGQRAIGGRFPDRGISVKNILTNAALAKLAKANPKAYAALQIGQGIKGVLNAYGIGASPLSLTKMEEKELKILQRGEDLGLNDAKQSEKLQELKDKKAAEEEKK